MHRRHVLSGLLGAAALPLMRASAFAAGAADTPPIEPVRKSESEWRRVLTPAQFEVLRGEGTERPGSSTLLHEQRAGEYLCAGCGLALFTSDMKYDSGTGWPSFTTTLPGRVQTRRDFKLILPRTEYHCARCGGHQGHLFDDGPPPTGQRWCNNGIALSFVPSGAGGTAPDRRRSG